MTASPRIPASERRELLVRAALRVIAERGVAGATTRAIVAEAGMSLASFHYAFRSHDEMMRELIAHVVGQESASVFAVLQPGAGIRELLSAGFNAFLDYVIADPGHEQVMQELLQYTMRTPGLEHLAKEQYDSYRGAVTEILVGGAAAAGVTWSRPVHEVARLIVTTTDGVTLAYLADRDEAAARRTLDFAADSIATLAVPIAVREAAQ
ncbi:TetR/AcrR family transcriptional regulator [Salinibacterium soli]|uniref:TetR family transcriptional regulator n=1 Tax=Antiquaquibacter soli TaxID=3064523 RepID=A0ABT9BQJ0_9MICO|nr:TetR family transcriptional regulator [Protaetiibacter sp. WY-16]MDO7883290.1 TetR family transcriptional regulator [Protaetiibacter sp. WY-16]